MLRTSVVAAWWQPNVLGRHQAEAQLAHRGVVPAVERHGVACDLRGAVRGNPVNEGYDRCNVQRGIWRWGERAEIPSCLRSDAARVDDQCIFCRKLKPGFKQRNNIRIIFHRSILVPVHGSPQGIGDTPSSGCHR